MKGVLSASVALLSLFALDCSRDAAPARSEPVDASTSRPARPEAESSPFDGAPREGSRDVSSTSATNALAATPADAGPPRERDGMLLVPAGPFVMGADQGGEGDERPAHEVTLGAFYLDRTEVTHAAYAECVAARKCAPPDPGSARANKAGPAERFQGPRQPVSGVSFHDAVAYCAFRNKRLPRESEWEKAARGADRRRHPWGNDEPTPRHAVFGKALGVGATEDVGTHPLGRGAYGHDDLAGNVWEWVDELYDPFAYVRPGAARGEPGSCEDIKKTQNELRRAGKQGFTGANPIPESCERVLRGGAFNYDGPGLRVTNRVHHPPTYRLVMAGFRCAAD